MRRPAGRGGRSAGVVQAGHRAGRRSSLALLSINAWRPTEVGVGHTLRRGRWKKGLCSAAFDCHSALRTPGRSGSRRRALLRLGTAEFEEPVRRREV